MGKIYLAEFPESLPSGKIFNGRIFIYQTRWATIPGLWRVSEAHFHTISPLLNFELECVFFLEVYRSDLYPTERLSEAHRNVNQLDNKYTTYYQVDPSVFEEEDLQYLNLKTDFKSSQKSDQICRLGNCGPFLDGGDWVLKEVSSIIC